MGGGLRGGGEDLAQVGDWVRDGVGERQKGRERGEDVNVIMLVDCGGERRPDSEAEIIRLL